MSGTYDRKQGFLTSVLQGGHFVCSGARREHSRSVYTLDCRRFFVVPSVFPVNIDNGVKVTSEPGIRIWSLVNRRGILTCFHRPERCQRVAATPAFGTATEAVPRCS